VDDGKLCIPGLDQILDLVYCRNIQPKNFFNSQVPFLTLTNDSLRLFILLLAVFTVCQITSVSMMHTSPNPPLSTFVFIFLYSTTTIPLLARAYVPNTVYGASSVFIEHQAMYNTGGYNFVDSHNWTFMIDFTQSWDISAPVYRQLSNSPLPDYLVPNSLLNDHNTWVVISNYNSHRYDIQLDRWFLIGSLDNLYPFGWALSGAADPSTGLFYIPNGFQRSNTTPTEYSLMQYDLAENKTVDITAPGAPNELLESFSAMWSSYLRKLVVFGGNFL